MVNTRSKPYETAESQGSVSLRLTEVCWPVFEFVTNFVRQLKHATVPAPEQVRYEALSAMQKAEELARDDPVTERAWYDRVKAMMIYLVDYKMLNSDWEGRSFWFNNRFETDASLLDHVEALGGEKFFEDCDELQKEYELAERRERQDKDELAGQLNLYFICLRLGFKGKYHDYPQELADYTRRLFARLPAYASTRGKEMFPEAYRHNQELKVDYHLGMSLAMVLTIFAVIIGLAAVTFRVAWDRAVSDISRQVAQMRAPTEKGASHEGATAVTAVGANSETARR
jgi:type VI protein secretion system component VasF